MNEIKGVWVNMAKAYPVLFEKVAKEMGYERIPKFTDPVSPHIIFAVKETAEKCVKGLREHGVPCTATAFFQPEEDIAIYVTVEGSLP